MIPIRDDIYINFKRTMWASIIISDLDNIKRINIEDIVDEAIFYPIEKILAHVRDVIISELKEYYDTKGTE